MIGLADIARQYWSAAYFIRRAPERDRSLAITILEQLAQSNTGPVQSRAADILKEINGKQPDGA